MSDERWLPVPGYEGIYEVSDKGNVRGLERINARGRAQHAKPLSDLVARSGHHFVSLCKDGSQRRFGVYVLVLMAFVGPRPPKHDACHWNDDPSDNRLEILRWGTRSENRLDAVRNGTHNSASKTHCPQGHQYSQENTYVHPSGSRMCRTCRQEYKIAHRERSREIGREYSRTKRAAEAAAREPREPITHCPKGHPYDKENTYVRNGSRVCWTCKRENRKKHYEANRQRYIDRAAAWRDANPERYREIARETARRQRAKKKAA